MKKRILCFLLSAAMLASVTACSGGGDTSSEGSAPAGSGSNAEASQPADSSEPIELTVLNWGSDIDVKINQDAYARLNEKFPNVTVKDNFVTGTATWSEYITKLLTMIGSGNSPDMVMMAIEGVRQLIDNDVVMPLDDRIEGDEDMQAVLDDISPSPHFSPENRCSFVALVYRNCNYSASSFSATLSATSMTLSIS